MNRSFKNDYKFGLNNENKILSIINHYFVQTIIKSPIYNTVYDFESDTTLYELKSRTNAYKKYNETLLGFNKIIEGDKKQVFLFSFTDGLYFIEYNEAVFNKFTKKNFVRNARADYDDKPKQYIFIPITHLIKIE